MANDNPLRRRIVEAREVLGRSRRFDLIFKYELAKAWAAGDPAAIRIAEEAYLEMVRSRNGFYEGEPPRDCPEDFIESFRRLFASIRERGYDMSAPAIPVDGRGELLNGAHRLCVCAAFGLECPVETSDMYPAGGSVHKTFEKGHIHRAVRDWGLRRYLAAFPDGALADDFRALGPREGQAFPDWSARARRAWIWKLVPALKILWGELEFRLKGSGRRAKIRRRIDREKKKISGFGALAAYWEEHR